MFRVIAVFFSVRHLLTYPNLISTETFQVGLNLLVSSFAYPPLVKSVLTFIYYFIFLNYPLKSSKVFFSCL